jgi:hypothetical protein
LGNAIFDARRITDIPRIVRNAFIESTSKTDVMSSEQTLATSWGPLGVALFMADERFN